MQTDPVAEWRRLTEYYRALGDEELCALAGDLSSLTDTAQQVFRSELKCRGLGDPETLVRAQSAADSFADARRDGAAQDAAESGDEDEAESRRTHDYTWKTLLCECDTSEQAWQICEMLKRAGIDHWLDGPGQYSPHADLDITNPRVLVAADQLDEARAILAQPVPQDIIDESRETPAEFVAPRCPACGTADPVLESADPVNTWKCEMCGREWTDGVEAPPTAPKGATFGIARTGDGKSRPATGQLYPQGE
jgi:ribosomal protein L37AE/L43A